jgi:glyoxylase-like metal-dependent hydrolase (beta-lactamase superfamily II)
MALSFPARWIHGADDCRNHSEPLLQTHQADAGTFIFRQGKCSSFEAPFMYLLVGASRSLLLDTGAAVNGVLPIRTAVDGILAEHGGGDRHPLIVAHSHAHGDHGAGDGQFTGRPDTEVVRRRQADIQTRFGIGRWPGDLGTLDLGGRILRVMPIPGHEDQHIAIYDEQTGALLTGDTLYTGLLVVNDWAAYRASARRLAQFAGSRTVSSVLGAHVEMSRAGALFPIGTTFQPNEHPLQLLRDDLDRWTRACEDLGDRPSGGEHRFRDFVIDIRG